MGAAWPWPLTSTWPLAMPRGKSLVKAKLPLYGRLLVCVAPLIGASGLLGNLCRVAGLLAAFVVLARRFRRCRQALPSSQCRGCQGGKPLEPTMDGLHRRVLELYQTAVDGSKRAEAFAMGMQRRITLDDGQEIAFWDLGPRRADKVVLLCNGLGARIAGWAPLLDALHSEDPSWRTRRIIVAEYRGQFASTPLAGDSAISVEQSAADISALAKALSVTRATLLCWSTGVQVGLQLALDRPDLVEAGVFIQGLTGEALRSLGQPFCTVPGMPTALSWVLRAVPGLLERRALRRTLHEAMMRHTPKLEYVASWTLWFFGSDLIFPVAVRYAQDMLHSENHFKNYCGYAVALGRHRIADRLPDIAIPALVVTGTPDFVTPARCSYDIATLLGGETRLVDDFGGSHYYIFEEPHKLAQEIGTFLERFSPAEGAKPGAKGPPGKNAP